MANINKVMTYELTYRDAKGRIEDEIAWLANDVDSLRRGLIEEHRRYNGLSTGSVDVHNYSTRKNIGTLVFGKVNKWRTNYNIYPVDPKTGKLIR